MLDPQKTVLVLKHAGREVGRISATAANAKDYIAALGAHYGALEIEYIEDPDYALVSQMLSGPRR